MTKVMLVEDDKSLREIYGVRLTAEGYEIISAGDGEEALAMAVKEKPDLILADVMMPKISGFDMLDILRSTPETKNVKVVMMTALSSEDQRARGEALGADRYLVKSQVGIEDVVRTIHDVLADTPVKSSPAPSQPPAGPAASAIRQAQTIPVQPAATQTATSPEPASSAAISAPPSTTAQPRPATTIPVQTAPTPAAPINAPSAVAAAAINEVPTATPQPQTAPPTPIQPTPPQPAETTNQLPQPTAPFSTAAPASLGEKTINPVSADITEKKDVAAMMDAELGNNTPTETPPESPVLPPSV